jgi:hypothetical protein
MKKIILLSIIMVGLVATNLNAQRYSINKFKYDSRLYVPEFGDPYNPGLSGVCSFFVPGLGQMLSGEVGRGFAFLGGSAACGLVGTVGSLVTFLNMYTGDISNARVGSAMMVVGFTGMAAIDIWSIVDAVNVAKVNNMYIRNLRKTSSVNFEMAPYVTQLSINNQLITPVGMTMRVKF